MTPEVIYATTERGEVMVVYTRSNGWYYRTEFRVQEDGRARLLDRKRVNFTDVPRRESLLRKRVEDVETLVTDAVARVVNEEGYTPVS